METIKIIRLYSLTMMLIISCNSFSQNSDDVINKKEKKENDNVVTEEEKFNEDFINGDIVFSDNFNDELAGEFPSKWTHMGGDIENSEVDALGKRERVVKFNSSSRMKPSFKEDDYLGDSFKIEVQVYFHGKGNEAYKLFLMNKNESRLSYQITIRGDGLVPNGNTSQYARMPNKLPLPGWRKVQLSFNNGDLKVSFEGNRLINNPNLNKGEDKYMKEFTHLEISALSRGGDYGAMINNIIIGHKGFPLYKKLIADGRILFHDILFDNGSYFIKPSSYPAVDRIVSMLKDNPDISIKIEGHTDANGNKESNQTLSEYRAKSVMHYIINMGIDGDRLSTIGFGEEKPMDTESDEAAYALNRRVEVVKM